MYDKRDDFDIVNFPFFDGYNPRDTPYEVYISPFGLLECLVMLLTFDTRNKILTATPLKQGSRYQKHFFQNSVDATTTWY